VPTYHATGPDQLPEHVEDLLKNCPQTGSGSRGVHRWLIRVANHLRHHVPPDQAAALIAKHISRRPEVGEIEEAIAKAYGPNGRSIPKARRVPNFEPDPDLIAQIVAERTAVGRSPLKELQASSAPIPATTAEIVGTLFPDPATFLCIGRTIRAPKTWALGAITDLDRFQFIVPNPMKAQAWIDPAGNPHPRCNANVLRRRYLICDLDIKPGSIYDQLISDWQKAGIALSDAQAAVLESLAGAGPLVLVTFSGNQSLQGWFFCEGESESLSGKMRAFFESSVTLGTDPAGWIPAQFFRMPLARRLDTGRVQAVFYFNPSNVR
jgi:hypothetical protein